MRHNKKKGLKLGTDASHTKAMKKSLAQALFTYDRIKTTETRAKALRSYAEPIITWEEGRPSLPPSRHRQARR